MRPSAPAEALACVAAGSLAAAPRAILFDLDGTLVDSVPDLVRCVNAALAAVQRPAVDEAQVRGWVGNGAARLLHRALTGLADGVAPATQHESAVAVFNAHYAAEPCRESRLYPGVARTLTTLAGQGIRLACVTNKPQRFVPGVLAAVGLDGVFECIVGGDTAAGLKPDPAPLRLALTALGTPAAHSLLVGDSHIDMAAGRAAAIPTVAVTYGYDPECDFLARGAVAVLDCLADLPTVWGCSPVKP